MEKSEGLRLDLVLQWTEATDEHLRSYVNGIPTGSGGTHENGLRAGIGKAVRNFIETHNLSPKGVTLTRRGHPRRADRRAQRLHPGAAVSGTDQGSAEQSGAGLGGRRRRASRARALAESQHQRRRGDRRAHHPGGARARGEPRGAGRGLAQERDVDAPEPARQVERLHEPDQRRQRALRRRRRFGRRLGQAGARPRAAGDSAAARQGAQHRERVAREGAREQGALGSGHRARLRARQELRPVAAALRQDHHPRRRRLGRQPHRDAAADVHLPPPAAAHDERQGVSGAAAALSHRHRQGHVLGARRCASATRS